VPAAEVEDFRAQTRSLPRVPVSEADLSTLYRFGDGGLSPLTGPMDREAFQRVLDEEVILQNGKKYAWTIPLAFPVDESQAKSLKPGQTVALVNPREEVVGSLEVRDLYPWDKAHYVRSVYGTARFDHPGGRMVERDPGTHLVGGEVRVLPQPRHPEYGKFVLAPRETRALFRRGHADADVPGADREQGAGPG
jgi:sulfate adenylyltransferase